MSEPVAPRLFGIAARDADVVAVIRRGPSGWCHVGRWSTAERRYEAGSWLSGKLFPQRCDVSPDGRWLCYMAFKGGNRGDLGESYLAISRLPWLRAVAAWGLDSTYSRGLHFTRDTEVWEVNGAQLGDARELRSRVGLRQTVPVQFAVERRRGWTEAPDSPPRAPDDSWDQHRAARLEKRQPGGTARPLLLTVEGAYAAFREGTRHAGDVVYSLSDGADVRVLDAVQWADWSRSGELLVATDDGKLQQLGAAGLGELDLLFEEDVAAATPDPREPPPQARDF